MKRLLAFLLIIIVLSCSGCASELPPQPTPEPTSAPTSAPTEAPAAEPTPEPTPTPEPLPTGFPENLSGVTLVRLERAKKALDEIIDFIRSSPIPSDSEDHPFVPADKYMELDAEVAGLYEAMLAGAESFEDFSLYAEPELIEEALAALLFDHPELEIYFTMVPTGTKGAAAGREQWDALYFEPEGRYLKPAEDMELVKSQVEAFDTLSGYVVSRIPEDFSVIDKYRMLACFISVTSEYAYVHGEVPRYATTAYGAIVNGYSICQGYAIGFEYLCRCANLDCRRVRNAHDDDDMHFWDIVTLDCGTYYVDVTWCDGSVDTYTDRYWMRWFMFPADHYHVANDGSSTTGMELGLY